MAEFIPERDSLLNLNEEGTRLIVQRLWPGCSYSEQTDPALTLMRAEKGDKFVQAPFGFGAQYMTKVAARDALIRMVIGLILDSHPHEP